MAAAKGRRLSLGPPTVPEEIKMFRRFFIAVIITMAAILETAADAIAATLPPPATDRPRLRVVASGRLCVRGAPGRRGGLRPAPSLSSFAGTLLDN